MQRVHTCGCINLTGCETGAQQGTAEDGRHRFESDATVGAPGAGSKSGSGKLSCASPPRLRALAGYTCHHTPPQHRAVEQDSDPGPQLPRSFPSQRRFVVSDERQLARKRSPARGWFACGRRLPPQFPVRVSSQAPDAATRVCSRCTAVTVAAAKRLNATVAVGKHERNGFVK